MKTPADGWDADEREALEELQDVLSRTSEPLLTRTDEDRLLARIYSDARRGTPSEKPARWVWLNPALATAALLVLALGAWFVTRTPPVSPATPVKPEQTIAATPAPPAFQLPLDKPDVTLSLSALTWRGSTGANQLLTDLKAPLDAFREGDYTRADREFTALESRYPQAIEVFFYAGVSRLFVNEPDRALAALTRAAEVADATFAPRVAWYRAIAEQRAGNLAGARERLGELCRGSSDRAAAACAAVKQLDRSSGAPNAR
jgi:hypothetical protein